MRVAFVGKGGSGKSTIAGTVARLLARDGEAVLALDVDTSLGLARSIGLGGIPDDGLPEDLAERRRSEGWVMREGISAEDLVDRYARDGPDGVRFLQLGKLPGHVRLGSTVAFRHVVETFRRPGWSIVGDLAAGTRRGLFSWAGFASLVAVVVEPTPASLLSAKRLRGVGAVMPGTQVGLVVNKVRDEAQADKIQGELRIPLWATLPFDEAVAARERPELAPLDAAPESPAIAAARELLATLRSLDGTQRTA